METCKFFLQSRCTKGVLCPFSHDKSRTTAWTPNTGPNERAVCIYFQQGKCRNGAKCTFIHPSPSTLLTAAAPVEHDRTTSSEQLATSSADTRSLITCKYYLHGSCAKGAACPYQHPVELPEHLGGEEESPDLLRSGNESGTLQRAILGAFVQFSHGAAVEKVSIASDFSSVRLDGLNSTSDVESVIHIARKVGFDVEPDNVRLLPMSHQTTCSAQITIEDPTFKKKFCDKLKANPALTEVTATTVPPRLPSWAASRRINCKKVIVSWHRPTRLVWLNFGNRSVAQRVSDKFNRSQYRISGHSVTAGDPIGGADHHNRRGITVLLQKVPYCITRLEVFDAIKADHDKPRHVELNKAKGFYDVDHSFTVVKSLLRDIGPSEFIDVTNEHSKRFKGVAMFDDENDARQAVNTLHDAAQRCLNNDKLSLQLMSSSKFKISSKIYQAIEQQITHHIPDWLEQHLSFRVYPDSAAQRRFVTLKIEGQSVKAVAKATSTIDEITAGVLVEVDGKAYWSSLLASNVSLLRQLKHIETTYDVVILRNKQKRHQRYFGPQHLYSVVQEMVLAQVKANASTAHVIPLDDCQFVWACRGGFTQISKALGVGAASFDITSTPRTIVVGNEEQYLEALAIVNAGSTESTASDARSDEKD